MRSSGDEAEKGNEGDWNNGSEAASSSAECRSRDDVWRVKVMLAQKVGDCGSFERNVVIFFRRSEGRC